MSAEEDIMAGGAVSKKVTMKITENLKKMLSDCNFCFWFS